mgnify:CR=1 FL=1
MISDGLDDVVLLGFREMVITCRIAIWSLLLHARAKDINVTYYMNALYKYNTMRII